MITVRSRRERSAYTQTECGVLFTRRHRPRRRFHCRPSCPEKKGKQRKKTMWWACTYVVGTLLLLGPRLVGRGLVEVRLQKRRPSTPHIPTIHDQHTFFSSSSSSFHFAPRSLPISPITRVLSVTKPTTTATTSSRALTDTGVGVLRLDPHPPVLAEEHVCGQCPLG